MESKPVLLRPPSGGKFWFDPGAFCLEIVVTGGEGSRAVFETLHSPADLSDWIQSALELEVAASDQDVLDAKALREAIWELAEAQVEGRARPQTAIALINAAAAESPLVPRMAPSGERAWVTPAAVRQVLSAMARDAIELFTGARAGRLRSCSGVNCKLIFVDTSRPGNRRWCSMDRCGNRAKVGAFRSKRLTEVDP
jgi:predicted RNA-binding Zn ribbon-like protein